MSAIKLKKVSKVYGFGDATTVALDEIDLIIDKGEFVAIMGPSGAGKSTLLHIAGLLDRPSRGTYNLDNRNVSKFRSGKRAKTRRNKLGFVFQHFNLLETMTALENVALPLAYSNRTSHLKRLNKASVMLAKVGLQAREYYYPHQLSGGQIQRVAIARALINNPGLIIADEPTGNLDTASSHVIMDLLVEINKGGNTIVLVTHNPNIAKYASRTIHMQDGRIVEDKLNKPHKPAKKVTTKSKAAKKKKAK